MVKSRPKAKPTSSKKRPEKKAPARSRATKLKKAQKPKVVEPEVLASKPVLYAGNPPPISETEVIQSKESLQAYLESIRRYPLLDPESELKIAKQYYETKDPALAKMMILANLRLVVKIAHDYARSGMQMVDLIQEGNIGLVQAIQEYDPYRGVKFSSYASYWIKAYIRSFILKNWSLVKIGTTRAQRALFYRLQKEKSKLEAMGIEPDRKLLAERFQVKEREIDEMSQRLAGRDLSLNAPVQRHADDSDEMLQLVEDPELNAELQLAESEIRKEFAERLDHFERTLSGKELVIFRERLRAENPKTLQEIGEAYGITRERVRQLEARVVEKLREYMKQNARFMENVIDV